MLKETWSRILNRMKFRLDRVTWPSAFFSAPEQWIRPLLVVCAVTLASFLLVDIFYKILSFQMIRHVSSSGNIQTVSAVAPETWHPAEHYHVITERNLFQTTLKAIAEQNAGGIVGARDEYTAFDLRGTIAVDSSMGYAIVEEKGTGKQKLYRLGEMIGSAKLVRITRSEAVLRDGLNEYVMKIKETGQGAAGRFGKDISISRQVVTQGLGDLKTIMSQAIIRPFFSEGVQQGFVVSNIVPGSLYQKMGLENGDVVTDVNNKQLEGADDILQLVNVMQDGESVSIHLIRKGKKETVNYTFH
ncbi:MAG: PDZ domain-containing protein [Syntrophaceae bacterium]|jgi:general secretion pathway protein C|nr:PDZ domain-containing protein [Syntrophaceae bacterium]HOC58755.1 PDZ domain-containing protein [Smithellaceae bacterium]HQM45610.1 PDZ domain-containing protein [Smithellaceae bacterium]